MDKEIFLTTKYVTADPARCRSCGMCRCRMACQNKAIGKTGPFWRRRSVFTAPDDCNGCMKCTRSCPRYVFTKIAEGAVEDRSLSNVVLV